jgi:hypothetical protein
MEKEIMKGEDVYACLITGTHEINIQEQQNQKNISKLPKEYQHFAKLFEKETGLAALPQC